VLAKKEKKKEKEEKNAPQVSSIMMHWVRKH